MIKRNFWNFFLIIVIFSVDRVSKIYFIDTDKASGNTDISITSFLNFNLIWNDGIAFGLFSFENEIYYNSLTLIIILITSIIFWMIIKTEKFEKLAFIMIFAGSLGNVFDRIYFGAVPDFIDFHINNFHWFIFNVADIFISLGVILLISLEILKKNKT